MSWTILHYFEESVKPEVHELGQALFEGLQQEHFKTVQLSGGNRARGKRFQPIAVKILGWLVDAKGEGVGKVSMVSLYGAQGEHAEATLAKKLDTAMSFLPTDPEADAKSSDVLLQHMLQYWQFGRQALREARSASDADTVFTVVLGAVTIACRKGRQDTFFVYRPELVATDVAALLRNAPPEL
ncbi:MAG: hypothetical protein Q8R32_00325 [bacterium]|nr:hypothetical protein [bacterium]